MVMLINVQSERKKITRELRQMKSIYWHIEWKLTRAEESERANTHSPESAIGRPGGRERGKGALLN